MTAPAATGDHAMTEFEIATLAFQTDSLALRESALWVAVAQVAASLAIGIAQVAVVWYGIRAMQRAGAQRAHEQDQRHTESMRALDALIDGQRKQGAALDAIIDGQRRQGEALSALIERTAPRAAD